MSMDRDGGRKSSSVVRWARCPAWCSFVGSILLGENFSGRADFFVCFFLVNMGSGFIPPTKPLSDESVNYGLVCAYMHSIAQSQKDPYIHILGGWMPATKTPSMHHPRRRNLTTPMVGLKTVTYTEISPQMVNPSVLAGERRRRRMDWDQKSLRPHSHYQTR